LAALGVGEHLIGGSDLFEPVFGRRVDVWVQLSSKFAVCALDVVL
jgi:hypothetical protein